MPTLYRKTAKGVAEIATREHRLTPRVRQALILVDGQRGDDELRRMIPEHADETLHVLASGGFIELVGVTGVETPVRSEAPRAPAAPTASTSPSASSATTSSGLAPAAAPATPASRGDAAPTTVPGPLRLDAQERRAAVRMLTDQVGPHAEMLAMKIERARDGDELQRLLEMARQSIRNTRGEFAATAFADRFLGRITAA